jgi:RNA polymerase sigma-70 factor (ECF subfamily)
MHELNRTTDESLLIEVALGDESAFEELVRRYESRVINLAYRYVHDADTAEDMAAEVFFRIWKYASRFRGTAKFSTWCYRIVVNLCLNYRESVKSNPRLECIDETITTQEGEFKRELPEPPIFQPEVALHFNERKLLVRGAIDRLPPQQKMAFILSWFEGYSYKEIAEIMELSVPAVESLLFRAKENIRKTIAPLNGTNPQVL